MTLNQLAYSLRKWPYDHRLGPTNKAYLSAITVTNISQSFYVGLQGGGKINWHRYGIKSRHCIGVVRGQLGTMRVRCILSSLCTFIYCRNNEPSTLLSSIVRLISAVANHRPHSHSAPPTYPHARLSLRYSPLSRSQSPATFTLSSAYMPTRPPFPSLLPP